MTENKQQKPEESGESPELDPVAEAQEGKGYGEDEGEREDSLEPD